MSDNITENLSRGDNWLRVLMVAVYAFIFWLGLWVACLVVILNLVVLLITGARNDQLTDFGHKLADYLHAVLRYATLVTDERPFPFADDNATPADVAESTPAAPPKPAKAPAKRTAKPAGKTAPEPAAAAPKESVPKSAPEPAPEPVAKPAAKAAPKPAAKKKKSAPRKKKAVKKVSSDDSGTD